MGEWSTLATLINELTGCLKPQRNKTRKTKQYYRWQDWRHLQEVGTGSLAIVSVIAACTGVILALQAAGQLEKIGALSYVANMVSITIVKELGPLLTAIILTGRSGAAFCAELATMKISEEIDALNVIGVSTVRFLIWPKFLAMVIMMPILTLWADIVGIVAGGLFSAIVISIPPKSYFDQCVLFLDTGDVYSGLIKAFGFGVAITIICCWQGLLAREGAADVGRRTTRAVVQSIFAIVLLDLFFTTVNYVV